MRREDVLVVCESEGCPNFGAPIEIEGWEGTQISCGPCGTVLETQAEWFVPPTDEELGIEPAPQRAAELIAQMTEQERSELAALIAPTPPTLGQEAKP